MEERLALVKNRFREVFGSLEFRLVHAPGRVNLIGEHTDYNEGFVLPVAIDRDIIIAASRRQDRWIHLYSLNFNRKAEFNLDTIQYDPSEKWSNYIRGVAWALQNSGLELGGLNALVEGNIPIGSGLSSSAALEVAAAYAFQLLNGFTLEPVEMALLCQKAENEFVGMRCGIMDQFIARLGKKGQALFIDCRSLEYQFVPVNPKVKVVVCDSKVRRDLVTSEYNKRRRECEAGVEIFNQLLGNVKSLREVTIEDFENHRDKLPENIKKRAEHVIYENHRVLEGVKALKAGNLREFGHLMNQSHISLRDLYEVSSKELDILVEAAWETEGVFGARLTGAGFGGCTVNLVENWAVEQFKEQVRKAYQKRTGLEPDIYVCQVEDGVGEIMGE